MFTQGPQFFSQLVNVTRPGSFPLENREPLWHRESPEMLSKRQALELGTLEGALGALYLCGQVGTQAARQSLFNLLSPSLKHKRSISKAIIAQNVLTHI